MLKKFEILVDAVDASAICTAMADLAERNASYMVEALRQKNQGLVQLTIKVAAFADKVISKLSDLHSKEEQQNALRAFTESFNNMN